MNSTRSAKFTPLLLSLSLALAASGCLQKTIKDGSAKDAPQILFAGATAAVGLDASSVQIVWSAPSSAALATSGVSVAGYKIYQLNSDGALITPALAQVDAATTSYIATGLSSSTPASYVVRSLSSIGLEDSNMAIVTASAYAGITSASVPTNATGQTQALINYAIPTGAAALRLYCGYRTGAMTLLNSALSLTTGSYTLTGLASGSTYTCKVLPVDSAGTEYANSKTVSFQTVSKTFGVQGGSYGGAYQGVQLVQAYGTSPGAPSGPKTPQVTLNWLPFTGAAYPSYYVVVRTAAGSPIDATTTTACTASLTSSCRPACQTQGVSQSPITPGSNLVCTDFDVAPSPTSAPGAGVPAAKVSYDYVVVLTNLLGLPEETPISGDASYRISVPMPPANMTLVHRDAANYEMCKNMINGSPASDPTNHQRCLYAGRLGATPNGSDNSVAGPTVGSSYYDFGYNLFVDRFEAGCNWTPAVCSTFGTNAVTGSGAGSNCYGTGLTITGNAATSGVAAPIGTVYFQQIGSQGAHGCFINDGTVSGTHWINSNSASVSQLAALYTNAASQTLRKPPLLALQYPANQICNATVDPVYGNKRLLRRREWVVAAAWPSLAGEPGAMTQTQINNIESVGNRDDNPGNKVPNGCAVYARSGATTFPGNWINSNPALIDEYTGHSEFTTGSNATKVCVSRFGNQDMVGNNEEWISDQIACHYNGTGTAGGAYGYDCNGPTPLGTTTFTSNQIDPTNHDMDDYFFDGNATGTRKLSGPNDDASSGIWMMFFGGDTATPYGASTWSAINPLWQNVYFNGPMGLNLVVSDLGAFRVYSNTGLAVSSQLSKLHNYRQFFYNSVGTATAYTVFSITAGGGAAQAWANQAWASRYSMDSQYVPGNNQPSGFRCGIPEP